MARGSTSIDMGPPEHDPISGWDIAKILWGFIVTGLGISAARLNMRLQRIEEAVSAKAMASTMDQRFRDEKADHKHEIDRLEKSLDDHRQETREQFSAVNARLDTIIERMMK